MKNYLLVLGFLFTVKALSAQDAADSASWTKGGLASLTFNQVSLYQWAAGGENSVSGAALIN